MYCQKTAPGSQCEVTYTIFLSLLHIGEKCFTGETRLFSQGYLGFELAEFLSAVILDWWLGGRNIRVRPLLVCYGII